MRYLGLTKGVSPHFLFIDITQLVDIIQQRTYNSNREIYEDR